MRDPARIDRIIGKLRKMWHAYPDMRLGQLVLAVMPPPAEDPYYVEDERFESLLDSWYRIPE